MAQENVYGAAILIGLLLLVIYTVIQERRTGKLVAALTDIAVEAQKNTRALDLAESLAIKVVPIDLVRKADATAEWLKQFTSDEQDKLIDAWRSWLDKVTDGQPNDLVPPPATQGVG